MGFDANGSYTRLRGSDAWKGDAQVGTKIMAPLHDDNDNDLANALSDCFNRRGKGAALANMSMGGFKLTNLGTPTEANDAATKAYADIPKPSTTGLVISGADANGRLSFTSPTGLNGLSFTGADMAWLARIGSPSRLVLNSKADGSGGDYAWIDKNGAMGLNSTLLVGGTITAYGSVIGGAVVAARSPSNAHFWFYGTGNVDRGVIYTDASTASDLHIRAASGHDYVCGIDGAFRAPSYVFAGDAYLSSDGNVGGTIWSNWGNADAYNAIGNRIEARASAWANATTANAVTSTRMAGEVSFTRSGVTGKWENTGYVFTGVKGNSSGGDAIYYARQPQRYIENRGWEAAFGW